MKNKKGFTLIEVLAVIVILAVIAGLIIPNIKRYKDKGNKEYYDKLKDNVVLAAKDYYSNHPEELPRGQVTYVDGVKVRLYTTELSLQNLINNNYLTNEVVDTQGNSCVTTDSKVVVTNINDVYAYHVCYFCNGKLDSDNSDEVCKYSNPQNSYCAIDAKSVSGNEFKKELVVTKFGDTSAEIEAGEGVMTTDDGKYYVEESGTYTFYLKDTKGNILDTCSYTLYIKDDRAPTCDIVKNGSSLDINVSDNYRLASVKSDINNSSKSYPCKSKDATIDFPISTKDTIQTKIDISNITTDITYTATVTDCSGNSRVCTIPLTPNSGGDSGDKPEICTNGATEKDKLVGFTKCDATCVNGSWQCNEESSCTEGDSFTEDIPCNSCANNCKTISRYYECINGKYEMTSSTNTDCGSSSTPCTPTISKCNSSGCQYNMTCDSNGNLKKTGGCIKCEYNPPSGCFVKGTKILTSTGYKNIEDIKVGDIVKSLNLETGKVEYKPVYIKYVFDDLTQELYTLKVNWETIKVTGAHNFLVKNSNNSIIAKAAKDLKIGDLIIDENGLTYPITEISYKKSNDVVYNFAVRDNHNYFVGEKGYLVHNQDEDGKVLPYCSGSDSSLVGKSCTGGVWDQKIQGTCIKVYCKKKSGGCFTLGTKVLTPTGYKNIEYLHLGDKVMSYNTQTKQMEVDVVTNTFIFNDLIQQIYDISTSNGMFTVSKQHRFYVKVNENLVLKTAGELRKGDILVNDKNEEIEITSINSYTSSIPVYNIEVLKNHNYYVTENNILTHNMSLQYGFNILASDDRSNQFK